MKTYKIVVKDTEYIVCALDSWSALEFVTERIMRGVVAEEIDGEDQKGEEI